LKTESLLYSFPLILIFACTRQPIPIESAAPAGSGEIRFSVSAMATFRRYMEKQTAQDFAVTIDGSRGFYSYCRSLADPECLHYSAESLLQYCHTLSGVDCRVFAKNRRMVWKNPGNWSTTEKVGMHFFVDHRGIPVDKLSETRN
jgi:hypothetical protein